MAERVDVRQPAAEPSPVSGQPEETRPWLARTFESLGNRHFRFL